MNGILFKPESIKAIIEGRKTQTRRVIKEAIHEFKSLEGIHIEIAGAILSARDKGFVAWWPGNSKDLAEFTKQQYRTGFLPRYQVGEVVYIKEAHYRYGHWIKNGFTKSGKQKWLFYFIKITGVRAERLQEITEADARSEGTPYLQSYNLPEYIEGFRGGFKELWNFINAKWKRVWNRELRIYEFWQFPWCEADAKPIPKSTKYPERYHCIPNPWVWVYTFRQEAL